MKNTLLSLLFIILMINIASAQFMFEGGLNMSKLSIMENGYKVPASFKAGETIGIAAGLSISDNNHIYFEPGVFFQSGGAKVSGPPSGTYTLNEINIPLNLEYRSGERCGARFFCGIGPYISDLLSGSYNFNSYDSIPANSGTLAISPANNYTIKQYDFGVGANIGYIGRKHLYFRAHYQAGLTNLVPNGDANNSFKQSCGSITVGYAIRGCNSRRGRGGSGGQGNGHWRGIKKGRWSRKQIDRRPNGPGY